jgi:tetraacyldisaccharide 4'-kinase
VTRELARALLARGRRPGIVLRGYRAGGLLERVPPTWASRPDPALLETFGDEALAHARAVPEAVVVAHPDRTAAATVAVAAGADVVILDDGFQHRRLARDVDIVLLDWRLPLGATGDLLPRGDLREPPSALARAHGIGWTRYGEFPVNDAQHATVRAARAELSVTPSVSDVRWRFRPGVVRVLGRGEPLPARRVVLVSGVARPESVAETAEQAGLDVLSHLTFPDHHAFGPADAARARRAVLDTGADAIVVTEKDEVRLLTGAGEGIKEGTVGVLPLRCDALDPLDDVWRACCR